MKMLLGSVIIIANLLISRELYFVKRKELLAVDQMISVTQKLITYISYGSYDVYQICEYAFSDTDFFAQNCFFAKSDAEFCEEWKLACEGVKCYEGGTCFIDIGSFLGSCDSQSQVKRLDYTLDLLINVRGDLEQKLSKDKKLIYSLGCFAGVTICLMLI